MIKKTFVKKMIKNSRAIPMFMKDSKSFRKKYVLFF